ncbi:MAG: hypothetical protein IT427_16320 [Pirellulales bacterium]|nr:hypothetical protein [Pirellulales bacterium]
MSDIDPLAAVFRRLLPLVKHNWDWWRAAVRRWASDPPIHLDDDGFEAGVIPVPLPPALTTDEQLALLAAIHDSFVRGIGRIDPWRELPVLPSLNDDRSVLDEHRLALRYGILLSDRVPELRNQWATHQADVELLVDEAERIVTGQTTTEKVRVVDPPAVRLADAEQIAEAVVAKLAKAKSRRKRGAKQRYDPRSDGRIVDAWNTGQYRTAKDLAEALGITYVDAKAAMDRHRKRKSSPATE